MPAVFSFSFVILVSLAAAAGDFVSLNNEGARQEWRNPLAHDLRTAKSNYENPSGANAWTYDKTSFHIGTVDFAKESSTASTRQSDSDHAEDGKAEDGSNHDSTDETNTDSASTPGEAEDTKSPPDSTGDASTKESDVSSPLDHMFIETRKPGLGSPLTETVFKDGALTGAFNSCIIDPADPMKADNSTTCYEDDAYNDRLSFRFTFLYPASELKALFDKNPPVLKVFDHASDIAEPSILTQDVNTATSTGAVSIAYGCKSGSLGTVALQLKLRFGEGEEDSTIIRWRKACRSNRNDKIEFGHLLSEKGSSDLKRLPFPSTESPLVVPANDVSTEVFVKLGQEGAQQAFLAPYVTSSDLDVTSVTLRGNHPSGGVLEGLEQTRLQVNYDCARKGESDISLSVAIPPFDNLTATWKKDCGGRPASSLQVGTDQKSNDVVENGYPTPRYRVGIENIGAEHSEEHLHLPGSQSDWTIYISNSEDNPTSPPADEAALHVGRITLTVEHPEKVAVLAPKVSSRGMAGWSQQTRAEYVVPHGESLKVSFHFLCRAIGESRILITVPVLQYDALEFGIAKECTHVGTAHRARGVVWTVRSVFAAGVFAVLILISFLCWRRRRLAGKGFEPLPVVER